MNIVVTGAAGKLGRWAVRHLRDAGHTVTGFDVVAGDEPGVAWVTGNHESFDQVVTVCEGSDAILHLSALSRPGLAPDDETFRTNVMGSLNVHEAARLLRIRRVVILSSEAILGWTYRQQPFVPDYLPIDEDHPVRPQEPYALSKEASEAISRAYSRRTGMTTVALRATWITDPDELEQLRREGGRRIAGFVPCNYVDVRDAAAACALAIERPLEGHHVFYILADDSAVATPLAELFPRFEPAIGDRAASLTGSQPSITNARAREVLGWRPRYSWRTPASPPPM